MIVIIINSFYYLQITILDFMLWYLFFLSLYLIKTLNFYHFLLNVIIQILKAIDLNALKLINFIMIIIQYFFLFLLHFIYKFKNLYYSFYILHFNKQLKSYLHSYTMWIYFLIDHLFDILHSYYLKYKCYIS